MGAPRASKTQPVIMPLEERHARRTIVSRNFTVWVWSGRPMKYKGIFGVRETRNLQAE